MRTAAAFCSLTFSLLSRFFRFSGSFHIVELTERLHHIECSYPKVALLHHFPRPHLTHVQTILHGHPTTVKYLNSEKQRLPRIFYYLDQLKMSGWRFHSRTIFEAYLINFVRFSEVYFFSHFTPLARLSFVAKRNLKFSESKIWRRGVKKIFIFLLR